VHKRDIIIAVLVALAWGFNFVVIKVGIDNFPPIFFSALRFTFAAFPLIFFLSRPKVSWAVIIGIATILGVIKFTLLFIGIDVGLSAGLASLLLQSQAFFTIILAALILGERPSLKVISGVALAFCGIGAIATTVDQSATVQGIALVLAAGLAWGFSNLIMRKAGQIKMLNLMVWVSLIPPIPLFILSMVYEGKTAGWQALMDISWTGAGAVLYIAFLSTILGFAGWGHLIARYGASKIAPFSLLVPIFGMSSSALFLNESFGPIRLIGAALILTGLMVTLWKQTPTSVKLES